MISSSMCSLIIDGIVGTTNVMEPLWSRQVNRSSIMLGRLDVMPGLTSLTHLATGRISETLAVHVATCIICQVRSPILGWFVPMLSEQVGTSSQKGIFYKRPLLESTSPLRCTRIASIWIFSTNCNWKNWKSNLQHFYKRSRLSLSHMPSSATDVHCHIAWQVLTHSTSVVSDAPTIRRRRFTRKIWPRRALTKGWGGETRPLADT